MKKIDVENYLNEYLSSNPISLIDILDRAEKFNNINEYKKFLKLNQKNYENEIEIYFNLLKNELEKIESFINFILENTNEENIKQKISDEFKKKLEIDYYNNRRISIIFINSLDESMLYKSKIALKFIFEKFNTKGLDIYTNLLKNENELSSYLGRGDKDYREVALAFLSYKLNDYNYKTFSRRIITKENYEKLNSVYLDTIRNIEEEKNYFQIYMKEIKDNEKEWLDKSKKEYLDFSDFSKTDYENFIEESKNKIELLEKTYSEKLKVEKPAEFMQKEAEKYKNQVTKYSILVTTIVIGIIIMLYLILSPAFYVGDEILLKIVLFNKDIPIYSSLVIVSIISIAIYFLRIFVRLLISSKHLETEYKQKYALTYFYLSLIKNGNLKDEDLNNKILTLLFSTADTGLIKNETSSDLEKILLSLAIKKS